MTKKVLMLVSELTAESRLALDSNSTTPTQSVTGCSPKYNRENAPTHAAFEHRSFVNHADPSHLSPI